MNKFTEADLERATTLWSYYGPSTQDVAKLIDDVRSETIERAEKAEEKLAELVRRVREWHERPAGKSIHPTLEAILAEFKVEP